MFDRDGNKLRGESSNKKSNVYYINPTKKYRIDADKIESTVVDFVGSLLKDNGPLDKAIKPEQELCPAIGNIKMPEKVNINAWTTLATARVLASRAFGIRMLLILKM